MVDEALISQFDRKFHLLGKEIWIENSKRTVSGLQLVFPLRTYLEFKEIHLTNIHPVLSACAAGFCASFAPTSRAVAALGGAPPCQFHPARRQCRLYCANSRGC